MEEIDFNIILLIAVVAIVLFAMLRYRRGIALKIEAWGVKLNLKAENQTAPSRKTPAQDAGDTTGSIDVKGNVVTASGEGAVAIGGDAKDVNISTASTGSNCRKS
ncbi:MAG: hypothetical protein HOM58_14930 [Rhodospirillaceae bacterium]|jgi:hypothetical protein|nr:hypothetical protein [Rhodospirillaceae bacterium]